MKQFTDAERQERPLTAAQAQRVLEDIAADMTLADLVSDPRNARKHTARNVGMIEKALHDVGAARSIVVDENNVVLAGNATIEAAAAAGIERVQVVDADGQTIIAVRRRGLTPEQKAHLALYDNRAAELAEWDTDVLASLGEEIDLSQFWTRDEIAELLVEDVPESGGGDAVPEVEDGPTRVQPGELWQLGRHRLLCGDSTKREDVERLMEGENADMVFTDPPYGQAKAGKPHHFTGGVGERRVFKTAFVDPGTWADPIQWLPVIFDFCTGNWFVMAGGERMLDVGVALQSTGMTFGALFTWKKTNAPPGMGNYPRTDCEYVWWMRGASASCKGMGVFDSLVIEMPMAQAGAFASERITKDGGEGVHPTQKPVAVVEPFISSGCAADAIVMEPFAGTGTTLIACERRRRQCRMMEIEPRYCDVILKRWEAETGRIAERIDG